MTFSTALELSLIHISRLLKEDGTEEVVLSNELKKGDVVMVSAGEIIPGDGEVIEGIASVEDVYKRQVKAF